MSKDFVLLYIPLKPNQTKSMKKLVLVSLFCAITVIVKGQNCNFSYSPSGALNVYTFTPNSAFSPNHYHFDWNFGDGTTSTQVSPSHTFNSTGPYYVCYNILDSNNVVICNACDSVSFHATTTCFFTAALHPNSFNTYDFISSVNNSPFVSWNYGDGGSGTGVSSSHTYSVPGTYTVCMAATDTNGTTCTYCHSVVVSSATGNCFFSFAADSLHQNTIIFSGSPAYAHSTITWDFNDGLTGTGATVTHTYNSTGVYTVCMTESDSLGNILCQSCHAVTISSPAQCSFTSSANPNHSLTIDFQASGTAGSAVTWDFGDNFSGTGAATSHAYLNSGTYNVCMYVRQNGVIVCSTCTSITVHNSTGNCTITYTASSFFPSVLTFAFQPASGTSVVSWSFGDGTAGTGTTTTHTYVHTGTYTVCATETDPQTGLVICHTCIIVQVSGTISNCQAQFISTTLALTGYFIDQSVANSNTTTYHWDFGDNTTSNSRFVQHAYSAPGTYNACLTIIDGNCTDTYCSPVIVDTIINPTGGSCRALFAIVQLAPYQVTVVNLSSGLNLNFNWSFGDGTSDTQPYPTHLYSNTGSYNLCLTVADANGCSDTYCDTLSVDSLGNVFRATQGFTINIVSPAQLTGINEIAGSRSFNVYPNPVSNELNIVISSSRIAAKAYRILSIDGAEVVKGLLSGFEGKANTQSLSRGAYFLEVTLIDGSRSYQSIIKN